MPETDLIPQISLAERDRRYKLVREKMAAEGLDILLLPANTSRWEQTMADSRYLTGIGGFATEVLTIFPAEGPVTAYVFNRPTGGSRFRTGSKTSGTAATDGPRTPSHGSGSWDSRMAAWASRDSPG